MRKFSAAPVPRARDTRCKAVSKARGLVLNQTVPSCQLQLFSGGGGEGQQQPEVIGVGTSALMSQHVLEEHAYDEGEPGELAGVGSVLEGPVRDGPSGCVERADRALLRRRSGPPA